MDLADFMGSAGIIQNALGYRGFAGINMRNNTDIPYMFYGSLLFHLTMSILALNGKRKSICPARVMDSRPSTRILTE
jgi:hypothetical protein